MGKVVEFPDQMNRMARVVDVVVQDADGFKVTVTVAQGAWAAIEEAAAAFGDDPRRRLGEYAYAAFCRTYRGSEIKPIRASPISHRSTTARQ